MSKGNDVPSRTKSSKEVEEIVDGNMDSLVACLFRNRPDRADGYRKKLYSDLADLITKEKIALLEELKIELPNDWFTQGIVHRKIEELKGG